MLKFYFVLYCFVGLSKFPLVWSNKQNEVDRQVMDLFQSTLPYSQNTSQATNGGVTSNQFAEGSSKNVNVPNNTSNHMVGLNRTTILRDPLNILQEDTINSDHEEGRSSKISARKGVNFNDLVIKPNNTCFVNGNECFNVSSVQCLCCSDTNKSSNVDILTKSVIQCSNCVHNYTSVVSICNTLCCPLVKLNLTNNHYSTSTTSKLENIVKEKDVKDVKVNTANYSNTQSNSETNKPVIATHHSIQVVPEPVTSVLNQSMKTTSKNQSSTTTVKPIVIHKPRITEVPDELESADPSIRMDGKIMVPVIVSILVIPLIGILILYIYRRSKDCWDNRHYKRMDFLIDGIYND